MKIYVFTDANKYKIACVVYNEDLKKIFSASTAAKYDDITINEYDAIRFALKKIKKNGKISLINDIVFCTDNTNAKKALDTIIYEGSIPPDKDRMNMKLDVVKAITKKIKKHIKDLTFSDDDLLFGSSDIDSIYSPSVHKRSIEQVEELFLQINSNKIIKEYKSIPKKKKTKFLEFLMKGNIKVDSLTK
jgi:hypothetical protein